MCETFDQSDEETWKKTHKQTQWEIHLENDFKDQQKDILSDFMTIKNDNEELDSISNSCDGFNDKMENW